MIFKLTEFQRSAKKQMKQQSKSYRVVANYMKVSKSVAHNWLNRKNHMRINDYLIICHFLDINPFQFIEDDEYQMRLI